MPPRISSLPQLASNHRHSDIASTGLSGCRSVAIPVIRQPGLPYCRNWVKIDSSWIKTWPRGAPTGTYRTPPRMGRGICWSSYSVSPTRLLHVPATLGFRVVQPSEPHKYLTCVVSDAGPRCPCSKHNLSSMSQCCTGCGASRVVTSRRANIGSNWTSSGIRWL